MDKKIKAKADYLFEVSWEVCNKVGGIYTVVKSKAPLMVDYYGDGYYMVGPYFKDVIKGQFEEIQPSKEFESVFNELEKEGIRCYLGKWLIDGEPQTILIDVVDFHYCSNQIKKELWDNYKVDCLNAGSDFDDPLVWSWASAKLIEKLVENWQNKKIVAHFHEWLSGAGLLYLKKNNVPTGLVFTTHATVLGRTIANADMPLYSILKEIDPEKEAYQHGVQDKHQLEKAAALQSDTFTTVSEITGLEAEYFLGRKPDVFVFNGLDIEGFPTFEEIAVKHGIQRNRMREFALCYFFPYYSFDIKNTLFYFIAGRYEFHNKGIDVLIHALGELNRKLKEEKSEKTIVVFFFIPSANKNIKHELLESSKVYKDVGDYLEETFGELKENIIYALLSDEEINKKFLFDETFLMEIKRKIMKFKKDGLPPINTHELFDQNDAILMSFRDEGLENKEADKVKVIFYSSYLTGDDGLLNLDYYETITGSHLGIFPSFYEPWGYTPLETAALGVASITTDLAGFGMFSREITANKEYPGIFVLDRLNVDDSKVSESLTEIMYRFSQYSKQERVENKMTAFQVASRADWKILIKNYIDAHNKSLKPKS